MDKLHLEHVKKHSYDYKNWNKVGFNMQMLVADTESCQGLKGDNTCAKVYGWGLGCIKSEQMIYGETLEQFFDTIINLARRYADTIRLKPKKNRNTKKYDKEMYVKVPLAIHNLGWDLEFMKYYFMSKGINYKTAKVKEIVSKGVPYETTITTKKANTYHIVQADNVVYGCEVFLGNIKTVVNRDGSETSICLHIDMFDSLKIIATKLENFPSYIENVDEMFYKIKGEYDYESFRENGHIQTDFELRYQYNDIYILREGLEQFYIGKLYNGVLPNNAKRTASGIAFDKLKEITFGEEDTEKHFREYFELDELTKFEIDRQRVEGYSYSGGFTHANSKYVGEHLENIEGCSLDINSSYPGQMAKHKFPYGRPKKGVTGRVPKIDAQKQTFILEVGFDYVKPKKKEFDLAYFKIGSDNIKKLSKIVGDVSGQEYFATNILNGEVIPIFKKQRGQNLNSSYVMTLTEPEYNFIIKHYDFGVYEYNEFGLPVENENLVFNGLEIGQVLIYKAEKYKFKKFVETFTEMKIQAKKFGNTALANQAKLFLNSSYGKFGSRQDKTEKDLILNEHGILTFTSENSVEYESKEFYRPYASFVTAYGRLQLANAIIHAVGVDNFIYCDTDSIYCLRNCEELIQDMNNIGEKIDPTKLGEWDVETVFNEFKVLGQKKYMYRYADSKRNKANKIGKVTLKCCGLPEEAQKKLANEGFESFYLGKEIEGKLQRRKVIGGNLLLPTLFTIKKHIF